jgi:hypothetical protein
MVTYFKDSAALSSAAEQELVVARGTASGEQKPKGYV